MTSQNFAARRRLLRFVNFAGAAVLVVAAPHVVGRPCAAQTYDFAIIADSNTPVPGGVGNFARADLPGISGGIVVFEGEDALGLEGVFRFDDGSLEVIVNQNTLIPGDTENFTAFGSPSNEHGDVAFRGEGPSGQVGIYTSIGGFVAKVADLTTNIPGGNGQFTNFGRPWICDGDVVFRATGPGGPGTPAQDGIYTNAGGVLRRVADTSTDVPGGVRTFTDFGDIATSGTLLAVPAMDDDIAFLGRSGAQEGIYAEIGGSLVKIADLNTPRPDGPGNFTSFSGPALAANINDGEIAFFSGAVYKYSGGTISKIAGPGDTVANTGGTLLSGIAAQGFSFDNGDTSFLGNGETGSFPPVTQAIYATQGGTLVRVIAANETIDGVQVGAQGSYGQGLENGIVVFNGGVVGNVAAIREYRWTAKQSGDWDDRTNWLMGRTPRDVVGTMIKPKIGGTTITGPAVATTLDTLTLDTDGPGTTTLRLQEGVPLSVDGITVIGAGGRLAGDGILNASNDLINSGEIDLGTGSLTIVGNTILSDGVIRGSGEIAAAVHNNPDGEIRLAAGQRQHWTGSAAHFNLSRIEVLGNRGSSQGPTELEIDALLTNGGLAGEVIARDATLRFQGGLTNSRRVLFSGGLSDVFGPINLTGGSGGGEIIVITLSTVVFYDDVVHNGDEIRVSAGSTVVFLGDLSGPGPITCTGGSPGLSCPGNVFIEAGFSPGNSPAAVSIVPDTGFGPDALVELELGGVLPGSQHDQLNFRGSVSLGGTLAIELIDGFVPKLGQEFVILNYGSRAGTFDAVTALPSYAWHLDYGANSLVITALAVPEPAAWILALVGLATAGIRLRKARRS